MSRTWHEARVLAIDPTSKGFGFVVFAQSMHLLDWGVATLEHNREARTLVRINGLLGRYDPEVVILEKTGVRGCRRGERVMGLLTAITSLARSQHRNVRCVSRAQVRQAFSKRGARTKHEIAASIVELFPELFPRLPPYRKLWMSEDSRMAIFDAASFALAYFDAEMKTISSH
ncbi:MAG: hypothetical protein PHX83_16125 [Acidobacteriia bacterium]|nr:hypothetical protein [Terriglobia bacterium]